MPTISIIVPVYKTEEYLEKCVDSILNQSFKDFELILVNDGSPDNSGEICESYKKKDNRVVVIHKENGGLSSARNAGIRIAKGKYIGFVDSDDYIDKRMYEVLLSNLERYNADISTCGMYNCYEGTEPEITNLKEKLYLKTEAIASIMQEDNLILTYAWNKLYKRHIFDEIKYPEGKNFEDIFIIMEIIDKAEQIYATNEQLYYYVHRGDSITGSKYKKKDYDIIEAYEKVKKYYENNCIECIDVVEYRLCRSYFWVLEKMALASEESVDACDKHRIIKYLKWRTRFILNCKEFSIAKKISLICLNISFQLYKMLVSIKK